VTKVLNNSSEDGDSDAHVISQNITHIAAVGDPWESVILIPKIETASGSDIYIPVKGKELTRHRREQTIETNGSAGRKIKLQQVNSDQTATEPSISAQIL